MTYMKQILLGMPCLGLSLRSPT